MDKLATTNKTEGGGGLSKFLGEVDAIWEDKNEIRKLFPADLTQQEFDFGCALGKALGANPFIREIWMVKYDKNKAAGIFCGRDFSRRKAQEQETYDGHYAEAIYSNDKFSVVDGIPKHEFNFSDRGSLVGAYCIVRRKGISQPFFVSVKFKEYNKGQSLWNTHPETQIKKVAECQGLKGAFQGVFKNAYGEAEEFRETDATVVDKINLTEAPKLSEKASESVANELLGVKKGAPEKAVEVEVTTGPIEGTKAEETKSYPPNELASAEDIAAFWKFVDKNKFSTDIAEEDKADVCPGLISKGRLREIVDGLKKGASK